MRSSASAASSGARSHRRCRRRPADGRDPRRGGSGDGLPAVEAACAGALGEGVHSADVILNILARRREPPPPDTITTPEALRLAHEPSADCGRYDSLRRAAR